MISFSLHAYMINTFRKTRNSLLTENRIGKYLSYAIGEIILVVLGILIALQINNYNDARKERQKELGYLKNIKSDLIANNLEMQKYMDERAAYIEYATTILSYFEGKKVVNWDAFNKQTIAIYSWRRFYPINNTFTELNNSGNFEILSNDSIKTMLLDLDSFNKIAKAEEDHFRFDSETLIYECVYSLMDLYPILQKAEGKEDDKLWIAAYAPFFKDRKLKNGFLMVQVEFSIMNQQLKDMKALSEKLIAIIGREMKKQ